jgi:two-component system, response regulator
VTSGIAWQRFRLSETALSSQFDEDLMQNEFILLVEDDPDDAALILRALRKNHIWADVEVAVDGVDALDFLFGTGRPSGRDPGDLPAVVLLDIKLPRINGFEVLRQIRNDPFTRSLPVIFVTSCWDVDDILRGYSLRADGYVCKSANFDKLVNALGHLGLNALLSKEPTPSRANLFSR